MEATTTTTTKTVEILGYSDLPVCEVCAEQEATRAILGKGSTIHRHIGQAIAICDDCLEQGKE